MIQTAYRDALVGAIEAGGSKFVCAVGMGPGVILGGSVRKGGRTGEERFFQQVREALMAALNGYIIDPALGADIDHYLVPPFLGDDAGVCGAMALGRSQAEEGV